MNSDRRHFLALVGSAAALAASGCREETESSAAEPQAPLQSAESSPAPVGSDGWPSSSAHPATLEEAWALARERKRPLLVLLAVASGQPPQHAALLTSVLERGDDESVAALHAVELACAPRSEVERVTNARCHSNGSLALAEATSTGTRLWIFSPKLSAMRVQPLFERRLTVDSIEWKAEGERALRENMVELARTIRDELNPDPLTLALAGLGSDSVARERLLARYASEVRERWVNGLPPGFRWQRDVGCAGYVIEGEPAAGLSIACGMSAVQAVSRRFLIYYDKR